MVHGTACKPYYVGDDCWYCPQCGTLTSGTGASDPNEFVNREFKQKETPYFNDPKKYQQLIEETKPVPAPKPEPIKKPVSQGLEQWFG